MSAVPVGRGPGAVRNERARLAILKATAELLAEEGYAHLTIEGIAARAHVGKPTIYRWWDSKSALIAECLVDHALLPGTFAPPNTGDVVADIATFFDDVIRFLRSKNHTSLVRSIIAAAVDNPDVAVQLGQRLGATPDSIEGRLRIGVKTGELIPTTSIKVLTETLLAVVVYRVISREGLRPADTAIIVPMLLGGSLAPARANLPQA
jgi:AcrR family transcriptional regulator